MINIKVTDAGDKAHVEQHAEVYSQGVLDPAIHRRFVEDLPSIAKRAGVPKQYLFKSAGEFCDKADIQFLQDTPSITRQGVSGYCIVNGENLSRRMSGMVGAYLRNFMDARMITLQDLLEGLKKGSEPAQGIVAVPNFHVPSAEGGQIPQWQAGPLLGWLMGRASRDQITIIATGSMASVSTDYGAALSGYITENFWGI